MAIEVLSGVVLLAGEAALLSRGQPACCRARKAGRSCLDLLLPAALATAASPQHFKSVQASGLSAVLKVEGFIV